MRTTLYPVELLRDHDGVYGIGLVKDYPFREPLFNNYSNQYQKGYGDRGDRLLRPLILRADVLAEGAGGKLDYSRDNAVLQMINPRRFASGLEGYLLGFITNAMLRRYGVLETPAEDLSKEQRVEFWRQYWGIHRASTKVMNRMIVQLLEQGADPESIRVARRFHFRFREAIYRAIAVNRRALQLAETFPFLAILVYAAPLLWVEECREEYCARMAEAAALVDKGASLKRVADTMKVPIHLQRLKPGAFIGAPPALLSDDSKLFHTYLPETTRDARMWLAAIDRAEDKQIGRPFERWVARNAHLFPPGRYEIHPGPGGRPRRVWVPARHVMKATVHDIADWVRACKRKEPHVTRPFSENMSLKTVTRLSEEWHIAVQDTNGPQYTFPAPWYPAGVVNNFEIVPLSCSNDLYQEGYRMKNCVGSYGARVIDGDCYIYSIQRGKEPVATLEIVKGDHGEVRIGQLRGPCNQLAPKEIDAVARQWLRNQGAPGLSEAA
jgi:PcfJ-like protein